jgi:hypothetical protein
VFDNYPIRTEVANFLKERYKEPAITDTTGDEYNIADFTYANESTWKTANLNVKLVTRKFPDNGSHSSNQFYHVLIYEFNEDVMKKYGLNKQNDLTKTF